MPTAETKLQAREGDEGQVIAWRAHELLRAGFDSYLALDLAMSRHVDLHAAIALVRRGCPAQTAARILL